MSKAESDGGQKMTKDEVHRFVAEHPDPLVKPSEIAEQFNVTPAAARYRLNQLIEDGKVKSKAFGRSAKGYWSVESPESLSELD